MIWLLSWDLGPETKLDQVQTLSRRWEAVMAIFGLSSSVKKIEGKFVVVVVVLNLGYTSWLSLIPVCCLSSAMLRSSTNSAECLLGT